MKTIRYQECAVGDVILFKYQPTAYASLVAGYVVQLHEHHLLLANIAQEPRYEASNEVSLQRRIAPVAKLAQSAILPDKDSLVKYPRCYISHLMHIPAEEALRTERMTLHGAGIGDLVAVSATEAEHTVGVLGFVSALNAEKVSLSNYSSEYRTPFFGRKIHTLRITPAVDSFRVLAKDAEITRWLNEYRLRA